MRRVTIRRGRVVPTSQHLSLTGSKFGMRQFGMLADTDSTMTGRRSPFEWWNTIMDRSQSRQDQMSQVETGSIISRATTTTIAGRREQPQPTPVQTPEKNKEPVTTTWEVTIPSPTPSPSPLGPSRTTNFSRSFSNRAPSSPLTQRSQATLSRISERSPHQSMISNYNSPSFPQDRTSHHSAINPLDNTPPPQPTPTTPRKSMTLAPPPKSRPISQRRSGHQDPRAPSHSLSSSNRRPTQPEPITDATPRVSYPKPAALPTSYSSSQLTLPDFSSSPITNSFYRQPNPSRHDLSHSRKPSNTSTPSGSATNLSRKSSSSNEPSGIFYGSQVPISHAQADYWSSRTDIHDFSSPQRKSSSGTPRSHSRNRSTDQPRQYLPEESGQVQENRMGILTVPGKHNTKVLRKKSLKHMQVVSSLGS